MTSPALDPSILPNLASKTVIVTGGANGIGASTVHYCHQNGANVVIADLPSARQDAEKLIGGLSEKSRVVFVPVNIIIWKEIKELFSTAVKKFGQINIVIANAGIMESRGFFDFQLDEDGGLLEDDISSRVIDVNLKGTMNTLRLAVFHMKDNKPTQDGSRGSVVLVSSTSGYVGGTRVVSYVSSKHGIIGLLRSAHQKAGELGIKVNAVAPFVTPTHITKGYSDLWIQRGLPSNTPEQVALGILSISLTSDIQGKCYLIVGGTMRELEAPIAASVPTWMGEGFAKLFQEIGQFFQELGGYPLAPTKV
ncbi:hypothetical protein F5884DRAFT_793112 [Xylogone sp. PMI_703]|nr:hypothetical protein F5884DRAFT_793112 [Xylogone sp. PMI_703]